MLGLSLLGHQVVFIEDSDDYESCYDPKAGKTGRDPSYGLSFTRQAFIAIGLEDCWAYHDAHKSQWHGPRADDAVAFCHRADVVLNLSAVNPLRPWTEEIDTRVLLDTDPVFTQIKHLQDEKACSEALKHNHFFTFGENIGRDSCSIPQDGFNWQATRQPVVPGLWSGGHSKVTTEKLRFTTIMQWDSYPSRVLKGRQYGMKSASFEPFMQLPARCNQTLEIAIGSHTAPKGKLRSCGWELCDSLSVTQTVDSYRDYLHRSDAEFGISKQGYVSTHSGWFSERSINYLASGKPVVVQDTGFSDWMGVDEGVFGFSNSDEALSAIDKIASDYGRHSDSAQSVAHEYFHYASVLERLLETVYSDNHHPLQMSLA